MVTLLIIGGPDVDGRISLMQFLRRMVDFDVIASGSEKTIEKKFHQENFQYFSYPLNRGVNPLTDVVTTYTLACLCKYVKPDIVHTFDTKPCVWGRLAARLVGVPVVIGTLPGLGALYTADGLATRFVRSIYEPLQRLACHISDVTIFQNQEDAELFITKGIVPASKARVIPGSGVQTDVFDPTKVSVEARNRLREQFGIPPGALVVTMVSRLIRSKGVLEFARAAANIRLRRDDVRFLLVGPDDHRSVDRLNAVEMEEMAKHVIWVGERRDIVTILAITDVFVLPTYYREGIPRVLLEAASMGVPLITTDSPGCREVVKHGHNGFLVPPRDAQMLAQAIEHLLNDATLRRQFGQEARSHAIEHFDLSKIASELHALYMEMLERKVET